MFSSYNTRGRMQTLFLQNFLFRCRKVDLQRAFFQFPHQSTNENRSELIKGFPPFQTNKSANCGKCCGLGRQQRALATNCPTHVHKFDSSNPDTALNAALRRLVLQILLQQCQAAVVSAVGVLSQGRACCPFGEIQCRSRQCTGLHLCGLDSSHSDN